MVFIFHFTSGNVQTLWNPVYQMHKGRGSDRGEGILGTLPSWPLLEGYSLLQEALQLWAAQAKNSWVGREQS